MEGKIDDAETPETHNKGKAAGDPTRGTRAGRHDSLIKQRQPETRPEGPRLGDK